jgi:hypothetical protein
MFYNFINDKPINTPVWGSFPLTIWLILI